MPHDYLTIVSGLPRSGTSMMMQMLDAGGIPVLADGVRVSDADNPRGYYEFELVKKTKQDATWLKDAGGKAVKIVHLLLMDLPATHQYRVLMMRRKMQEILASQKTMLDRNKRPGASVPPEQLARIFQQQFEKIDRWLAAQPNFRVLSVDYNALLADPKPQVEAISAFLDGRLDAAAMQAVVDPALYRQRG